MERIMSFSSIPDRSLQTVIERELRKQSMTLQELSHQTGINRGVFSAFFSRIPPKPMSIRQLDLIACALHQPEGWLYPLYLEDCFADGKTHWKQAKALLLRCVEMKRYDWIERVLVQLMEEPVHIQGVFLLGESLYEEGQREASIPFYRCVCETEIKQHSERLAISQYKWFRARLGPDLRENMEAALQFAPFRSRLPETYLLDGLLHLANVYFTLQRWEDVMKIADELLAAVTILMQHQRERKRRGLPTERLSTERNLVVYYASSYLLKGNALEWCGRYEEALSYIPFYEELSSFDELDEQEKQEVKRFSMFAQGNRLNLRILMGHVEDLPDYILYLDKNPEERLPGLLSIMSAANRCSLDVDEVIDHYRELLEAGSEERPTYYQTSSMQRRQANLCYQLAIYQLTRERYRSGMDWLLQAVRRSTATNNTELALNCAAYMERFRGHAEADQLQVYEAMMKEVIEHAQTSVVFPVRRYS
ncbi:hypothetical protein [Gorillibacterium timonense]|uniref:hypothetical protein n=1 Tax=Gorillibacterium timonense TaxID=1689269 RepID=UPI00071D36F9|nr:hypothetical protein [Gorillibacterium timonense]